MIIIIIMMKKYDIDKFNKFNDNYDNGMMIIIV